MEYIINKLHPRNFIKTEVGIIPKGWDLVTYGEVFQFLRTANFSRKELDEKGDVHYIHYGDIHTQWNHFIDFNENKTPKIDYEKAKQFSLLRDGDLIVADASEDYEGICASIEVKNINKKLAISGLHTVLLRDNNQIFVNCYRGFIHSNAIVKKQFDKLATGLKVYGLSSTNLRKVKIPLPPKREQTAIANALSDVDNLIQSLEKLIAKKRMIKQGAMQRLLKPGSNWLKFYLGDLLKDRPQYGIAAAAVQYKNDLPTYLRITDISEDGRIKKTDLSSVDNIKSGDYYLEENDIVFARTGNSVGKSYLYDPSDGELVYAGFLIRVKVDPNKLSPVFLKYYVQTKAYWDWVNLISTRTGQPGINGQELKTLPVFIPPKRKEQDRVANILYHMDEEIEKLESKHFKYKQIKQGMMQQLLTGKIRLV